MLVIRFAPNNAPVFGNGAPCAGAVLRRFIQNRIGRNPRGSWREVDAESSELLSRAHEHVSSPSVALPGVDRSPFRIDVPVAWRARWREVPVGQAENDHSGLAMFDKRGNPVRAVETKTACGSGTPLGSESGRTDGLAPPTALIGATRAPRPPPRGAPAGAGSTTALQCKGFGGRSSSSLEPRAPSPVGPRSERRARSAPCGARSRSKREPPPKHC